MTTRNTEEDDAALLQGLRDTNDAIRNSISRVRTLLSLPSGVGNYPLNYLENIQEISVIPSAREFNRIVSEINELTDRDYFRESIHTVYNSFRDLAQLVGGLIRQSREFLDAEFAADREAVERLTQIVISADHVNAESECSICTEPFQLGDDAQQMPCHESHIFHARCLLQWLERRDTCPICRTRLLRSITSTSTSGFPNGTPD